MQRHAEKKALAALVSNEEAKLNVSINFKSCMDCHEFFKVSSSLLGRRIHLLEPKLTHKFIDGRCSCQGRWRWEARFALAKPAVAIVWGEERETDTVEAKKRRKALVESVECCSERVYGQCIQKSTFIAKLVVKRTSSSIFCLRVRG